MAEGLILETTFLVDLERKASARPGPAHAFLERHPDVHLHITFTVAGELAATALAVEMPVVTRNLGEYRRVPGLDVPDYMNSAAD